MVLKTTRGGYDGKGVWVVADERAAIDCARVIVPANGAITLE